MNKLHLSIFITFTVLLSPACSVFGDNGVEEARYQILLEDTPFDVRTYPELILVSTPMETLDDQRSAFSRLFSYISGSNKNQQKISMTAPVFMEQDQQVSKTMAFVMPTAFKLQDTPLPLSPLIKLETLSNYTVASIRFNGRLSRENINKHKLKLKQWIVSKSFKSIGPTQVAGYNGPLTLPSLRRNEILIPIAKPLTNKNAQIEM